MKTTWLAVGFATAISAGCAGTQKLGQTSATGPEDNDVAGAGAAPGGADPLAAGAKKPASNVGKRTISESQQADFAKAVRRWETARRDGSLKNDCGSIASDFGGVADDNPAIVEARGNQAAVLAECGREDEAAVIWEKLATGPKPYAPAMTQLGYVAWKSGDVVRAETLFNRAVESDKLLGSVSARLNLAQILRDKARRSSSTEERLRFNREAVEHLRAALASDGNNLQAYSTLCYFYYDLELLEMARLVGTQAILRAEEIATGKLVGTREKLASAERAAVPAKGKGKGKAAADEAPAESSVAVVGTGYTPEMKKALGMVYNTLGLVWLKRKDVTQGIASFRKAVEQDPDLYEARLNLAALSLNYRDYVTAEQNFRAVLGTQPKNYEAVIGLGVALRGNRKFDEAEQQYLAAQKLEPQNPDSYFNLGLLYQEYKGTEKPACSRRSSSTATTCSMRVGRRRRRRPKSASRTSTTRWPRSRRPPSCRRRPKSCSARPTSSKRRWKRRCARCRSRKSSKAAPPRPPPRPRPPHPLPRRLRPPHPSRPPPKGPRSDRSVSHFSLVVSAV